MKVTFVSKCTMPLNKLLQQYLRGTEFNKVLNYNIKKDEISNSKIRRAIFERCVMVNNITVTNPALIIKKDDRVTIYMDEQKFFAEKSNNDIDYNITESDILFEDDAIIAYNKPANFPLEPTIVSGRHNLHDALAKYLQNRNGTRNPPYIGLVHRIDRTTSGVVIFAKTRDINKQLHKIFESREVEKYYLAAITNLPNIIKDTSIFDSFTVKNYLARISNKSQKCKWGVVNKDSPGALYSKTEFKIIDNDYQLKLNNKTKSCIIIKAKIFTGRTHQIRVHLSSVGSAILGDALYGGEDFFRVMLHSYKMIFNHPVTKELITIIAKSPY